LRDVLPESIANRRKKGFWLPCEHWMRGGLAGLVEETCSDETVARRGLLDPKIVARARGRDRLGTAPALYPNQWTLMIFELWCRAVLDEPRTPLAASHGDGAGKPCLR